MKKLKKIVKSPVGTLVMFVAAIALLMTSSIGGARAALIYSATYASGFEMYDIGVELLENGNSVSKRDYNESTADGTWNEYTGILLEHMLDDGEPLKPGKAYDEVLSVHNAGTINQYVRVSIYKYWVEKDENIVDPNPVLDENKKKRELSPDLIDLNLLYGDNGWILDEKSSTDERTVLYYQYLLYADGEDGASVTTPFSDTLTINGLVATKVTQETETTTKDGKTYTTIKTIYDYDGARFQIEATVDAVQDHNVEDAVWSAWGRRVSVENGVLRLAD